MIETYKEISSKLIKELNELSDISTYNITSSIKLFFKNQYTDKQVYYSNKEENNKEFLWDITILSNKQDLKEEIDLNFMQELFCIVESELGGESASSPLGIQKNLRFDFHKLMQGKAKMKYFIGAYSIGNSKSGVLERVEDLHKIYKCYKENTPICLIMIEGFHNSPENKSRQIRVNPKMCSVFVLEPKEIIKL